MSAWLFWLILISLSTVGGMLVVRRAAKRNQRNACAYCGKQLLPDMQYIMKGVRVCQQCVTTTSRRHTVIYRCFMGLFVVLMLLMVGGTYSDIQRKCITIDAEFWKDTGRMFAEFGGTFILFLFMIRSLMRQYAPQKIESYSQHHSETPLSTFVAEATDGEGQVIHLCFEAGSEESAQEIIHAKGLSLIRMNRRN